LLGAMVDTAAAKYLSDNIGGVLSKALAEMAVAQPANGVDYLAQWLKVHSEQEQEKARLEKEQKELQEARAATKQQRDEREAKQKASQEKRARKEASYEECLKKFGDPKTKFEESFWSQLVQVASSYADVKAVYLGLVDEEGLVDKAGPLITYQEATAPAQMMLDQELVEGTGVTWGAVTETPPEDLLPYRWEPPKAAAPAAAEGDEPPEESKPAFQCISIPCVSDTLEPRGEDAPPQRAVHFFDMTRLGAFLAVPLVYTTFYQEEARTQAKEHQGLLKARAEKFREYEAAYAEALATSEEAAKEVVKPPELDTEEPVLTITGKAIKMVLCLDTLGTNTAIEEAKFEPLIELCKACGKCKEETEKREVSVQAQLEIDEGAQEHLRKTIADLRSSVEKDLEDAVQADKTGLDLDDEGLKELVNKLVTAKWQFVAAANVFMQLKDEFLTLTTWKVVPADMLNMVAATALFFGYKKEELYPKRKANLRWDMLCKIMDAKFFEIINDAGNIAKEPFESGLDATEEGAAPPTVRPPSKADVLADRRGIESEQKMKSIKEQILGGYDDVKAMGVAPSLGLLYAVLNGAFSYREAHLKWVKANYNKRKEKAAAEEKEFDEPPLESRDDDFEALESEA